MIWWPAPCGWLPACQVVCGGGLRQGNSGRAGVAGNRWHGGSVVPHQNLPLAVFLNISFLLASAGTARPRVEKEVPPSVDVLGWCTWDA